MSDHDQAQVHCVLSSKEFSSGAHPVWCPGCGDFGVLAALERGLAKHGRLPHEVVLVSGIGCSSRLPGYMSTYGFHGVHGRALAVASGLKLVRPDLEVIAVGGDGDGYSIGGNHFIHACRRNIDMLYVVMDNRVYGMTKGQPSPTTEPDWNCDIAPGGIGLRQFNPLAVAITAGANFVARGFSGDPNGLADMIVEGLRWPGFAFIEVMSPCITFRPEQTAWKKQVRPATQSIESNRAAAAAAALTDNDLSIGVLYRGERAPIAPPAQPQITIGDIERKFFVGV